jgi:hypothetical protein
MVYVDPEIVESEERFTEIRAMYISQGWKGL